MCGIIGWKNFEIQKHLNLIQENNKRGGYSVGYINTDNHFVSKHLVKDININDLRLCDNGMLHFRAPTTNASKEFVYTENFPLEYKNWFLVGNGVINYNYFQQIKDEDNANDLYYILKQIQEHGIEVLKKVKGVFAFAIINPENQILLIRKDFPLYYNNSMFSSIEFPNSSLLEHGVVYNWTTNTIVKDLALESVYLSL